MANVTTYSHFNCVALRCLEVSQLRTISVRLIDIDPRTLSTDPEFLDDIATIIRVMLCSTRMSTLAFAITHYRRRRRCRSRCRLRTKPTPTQRAAQLSHPSTTYINPHPFTLNHKSCQCFSMYLPQVGHWAIDIHISQLPSTFVVNFVHERRIE